MIILKTVQSVGEKDLIRLFSYIFSQKSSFSVHFHENMFGSSSFSSKLASISSIESFKKESFERAPFNILGGPDDDCAVMNPHCFSDDIRLVCSTDMLHEQTDFPEEMSFWQRGWMSAAVSLSDIASMGALPLSFYLSVGFPESFPLESAIDFAAGVRDCASLYGCRVVGGDTDSHSEFTVVGTVIGAVPESECLGRSGSQPGDYVCLTGFAGNSALALDMILSRMSEEPDLSHSFFNNLYLPVPRVLEGRIISGSGHATSMTDTSDGLSSSLHNLREASGFGFDLFDKQIPISEEFKEMLNRLHPELSGRDFDSLCRKYKFFGGGDFELLFTVRPEFFEMFSSLSPPFRSDSSFYRFEPEIFPSFMSHKYPCPASVIGRVSDSFDILIHSDKDEQVFSLPNTGYASL